MSPHRIFILLLAVSVPITAVTFIKNTGDLTTLVETIAVASSVIITVLILTRKYWKNSRWVSSC